MAGINGSMAHLSDGLFTTSIAVYGEKDMKLKPVSGTLIFASSRGSDGNGLSPATMAFSSMYPERRVSLPSTIFGLVPSRRP